jgi:hypothetical protein
MSLNLWVGLFVGAVGVSFILLLLLVVFAPRGDDSW